MDGSPLDADRADAPEPSLPTKHHYLALDGLRGVAALVVVAFHTLEVYSHEDHARQIINHGYLAVDFFFLLSGFVVAYAYDDRWDRMTLRDFAVRRLVRLQPMVVMGSLIGAALFYPQAGDTFPLIAQTPVWKLLLVMLVGCTLVPLPPSMDIRGWDEMHPLDGPAWSLFFEYVANVLYALVLRRLPAKALAVVVLLAAAFLVHLAVTSPHGDLIGGWSITTEQLHIGSARMLAPFLLGLLLMRIGVRLHVPGAFLVCSAILVVALALPRVGGSHLWINGLYEAFCVLVLFPLVIAIGAGDGARGPRTARVAKWLGDLSYPLYITHYPLIYIYTGWVLGTHPSTARGAAFGVALFVTAVAIAYASLKLYDEPVRRRLAARFLARPATPSLAH